MSNTLQEGAIEGNAADDALMLDQGYCFNIDTQVKLIYIPFRKTALLIKYKIQAVAIASLEKFKRII